MHKDGKLDVDMNNGFQGRLVKDAVENVSFVGKQVINGRYQVAVHNYRRRETSDPGFTLEVELYGALHQFQFPRAVSSAHMLYLEFRIRDRELVELRPLNGLIGGSVSQEKWGLKTGQLVRVNTLMKSPNHWDGNEVGNLHWFFMLEGALNPEPVRGIYNEFLKSELDPHRKVFEALGNKTKAPFAPEQLSGLGFSSTRGDTVSAVVRRNGVPKSFNIQF